jgi:acetyltransferase-like isoleucine patch superfamily enzyme
MIINSKKKMSRIKEIIMENPRLKRIVLDMMIHPVKIRPRFWLRLFQFLYIKRGKGAVICRSVRCDIVPFRKFQIGRNTVVEDFTVVNNAVGDIIIGDNTRVGIGNTLIGPAKIGNNVIIAQHVVIAALNHGYMDVTTEIVNQGVTTAGIVIGNDVWIGANSTILAGVHIGEHVVIGAGSVVTKDIPSYCVAVGNPAQVVKRYDQRKEQWIRIER